jgi:hypothetical protein
LFQGMLVEEQNGGQSLVLYRGRNMFLDGQVSQEAVDIAFRQLPGMLVFVELDVPGCEVERCVRRDAQSVTSLREAYPIDLWAPLLAFAANGGSSATPDLFALAEFPDRHPARNRRGKLLALNCRLTSLHSHTPIPRSRLAQNKASP